MARVPPAGYHSIATSKTNINSKITYEYKYEITTGG